MKKSVPIDAVRLDQFSMSMAMLQGMSDEVLLSMMYQIKYVLNSRKKGK